MRSNSFPRLRWVRPTYMLRPKFNPGLQDPDSMAPLPVFLPRVIPYRN